MNSKITKIWLTLCWALRYRHKLYYERQPKLGETDLALQRLAISFSRGKLTWGKTVLSECRYKACGRKVWTLTRDSQICKRYNCYMAFYLHPERYTLK